MSVHSGRAYRTEVSYPIIWTCMLLQSQGVSKHFESTFLPNNWRRHLFSTNHRHNPQIEYFFPGKIPYYRELTLHEIKVLEISAT